MAAQMSTASTMTPMITPIQMMSTNRSRPSAAYSERGFQAVCGVSAHAQASRTTLRHVTPASASARAARRSNTTRIEHRYAFRPASSERSSRYPRGDPFLVRRSSADRFAPLRGAKHHSVGNTPEAVTATHLELEAFAAEVVACRACEVAGYLARAN